MNIEKYISDLLYRYQCVTVPGFGAFLTEFKSAQINTTSNVMSPPKKSLSFNYHLQNNDGLLANHISLEENISYSEAVLALKNETEKWSSKLELGENLVLENIGELLKNHEGNIMFIPSELVNYNTDSFGLTDIVTPDVARIEVPVAESEPIAIPQKEKFETTFNKEINTKTAVEKLFETKTTNVLTDVPQQKQVVKENPPKKKKSKVGAFVSVAALIAVVFGGLYGYKLYNDKLVDELTLVVQNDAQEKVEKTIQEATFVMSNPIDAIEVKVNDSQGTTNTSNTDTSTVSESLKLPYHIIAGSFKNEDNAKKRAKELQDLGYDQATILGQNSYQMYMVVYKSFSDYNTAINELKVVQQNDNEEAWLFTKL